MKNNNLKEKFIAKNFKSVGLKTNLFMVLFSFLAFQIMANPNIEQNDIKLTFKNTPLSTIINSIQKQTDYNFFYINDELNLNQKKSINIEEASIENVLNVLLDKTDIKHTIVGSQIILKHKTDSVNISKEITGTVKDPNGYPLPQANIVVKGTTIGTVTDFDGNFTITVPDENNILSISFLGFETLDINITNKDFIEVTLTPSAAQLNDIVLIGSRNPNRTALTSAVPVDVINLKEIKEASPQITVNEILNYAAPSFTSNAQAIADGTDHVQPASLRGLGPDQLLVLINGKRRHKSALVNVNGSFGRGNVGTDLSTIPTNAIERIEILRDGAAAQYGSDAIAGVINIVLKTSTNELELEIITGANFTSEIDPDNNIDGEKFNIGINYGFPIQEDKGFINFTGNVNYRGATNRMQEYTGAVFNGYNSIENVASQNGFNLSDLPNDIDAIKLFAADANLGTQLQAVNDATTIEDLQTALNFDNTENELDARGLERTDFNIRFGQSQIESGQFFANMEYELGESMTFYAFGGLSYKKGNSAGFYRLPNQARTFTPIYLNGFLPEINSDITDQSFSLGLKGKIGEWDVDMSNTNGVNSFLFNISNSSNASLQEASPFEANAGGFRYSENSSNFSMTRFYDDIFKGFNLAFGAEFRVENYQIIAGDETSYELYNTDGNPHDASDPTSILPTDFFGNTRNAGIQVFPGFRPSNEVDVFRNSFASYLDVEADFTDNFRLTAALRFERFSDFGSTLTYKMSSLYKVNDAISLRGSLQTGFRAPSLHQIYFNSTSTITTDGVPQQVATFSNTSRIAQLIGVQSLKEETSIGFTGGITAKVDELRLKLTLDAYFVGIDDRVVLTDEFSAEGEELEAIFDEANATRAQFFGNTINTETKGLDFIVDHNMRFGNNLKLTNILALTLSETKVVDVNIPEAIINAGLSDSYYSNTSRVFAEAAVPRTKGNLSHNLSVDEHWNIFLRNSYFGEVEEATNNTDPDVDRFYSAKVVTDLSLGYRFNPNFKISVGSNNLFDIYPDESDPEFQSDGRFRFSRRSKQFGYNGRFLFMRLNYSL